MNRHSRLALGAIIFLFSQTLALADTLTWTGASIATTPPSGTIIWSDARNWSPNQIPATGDDLILDGGVQTSSQNTIAVSTTFNTISVKNHAIVGGNPIALTAGLTAEAAQISLGLIKLNNAQFFRAPTSGAGAVITAPVDTNGHRLSFNGPGLLTLVNVISGTGGLSKFGSGTVQLTAPNTYIGATNVTQGTLLVSGAQPNSNVVIGDVPVIGASPVLGGTGTVGSISFGFGGAISPGGSNNGPGVLTIDGALASASTLPHSLLIDLKGTNPGTSHDQVKTTGGVTLSSAMVLTVTLDPAFTPSPGTTFIIIKNDSVSAVQGNFAGSPEGSLFTVGNTTFAIGYRGGDGNDVILHLPTTRTWDGGGADNNWMTAANWVNDVAPAVGDDLVFPAGAARLSNNNNFPAGTLFNSITFSGAGYFLGGNALALRSGITDGALGNTSVGVNEIRLAANQSFSKNNGGVFLVNANIDTAGRILTILGPQTFGSQVYSGIISGTGGINMAALHIVRVEGTTAGGTPKTHTYTGPTTISSGTLVVRAFQPGSPVQVTGGILAGRGRVGPVTATGGRIRPVDGVPETLSISGDLQLNNSATMQVAFSRNSSQVLSGILDVTGTVTLGSSTLELESNGISMLVGDQATIINNDGTDSVVGTFVSLPEGTSFAFGEKTVQISYQGGDGNDVVLRVTAVPSAGISFTKLTNGTDNDLPPGPVVPVGSTVTFTYLVKNTGNVTLHGVTVKDDNSTPDDPDDDFNASFSAGDPNGNGALDSTETFTFSATRIVTAGQYTNIGKVSATPQGGPTITATNPDNHFGGTPPSSTLANISTRLRVQAGDSALIGGVIATGTTDKKVIIRAIGPTLTDFGLPGALQDPTLELFQGNLSIASNDDWVSSSQANEISDSGLAPGRNAESAVIATLTPNQNYTALVRGKNGETGVGVVEVFDLDQAAPARLANISTRGFVDVDDNVMIAGLIVGPSGAPDTKVLVRALGPTLGDFGVPGFLANPTLDLVSSNGTVIRSNNDWKDSQQSEIQAAQLAPSHDAEAALIQSLAPGAYTAVVRGLNRTTGVGLVEVYNIP